VRFSIRMTSSGSVEMGVMKAGAEGEAALVWAQGVGRIRSMT